MLAGVLGMALGLTALLAVLAGPRDLWLYRRGGALLGAGSLILGLAEIASTSGRPLGEFQEDVFAVAVVCIAVGAVLCVTAGERWAGGGSR